MSDDKPYYIGPTDGSYSDLLGPDGFDCRLGELEDRIWERDGEEAVDRLNEQHTELLELRKAVAKMSHRKCWDCGNVAYHLDTITPHVLCEKCGSQDTRLIRKHDTGNDE